MLRNSGTGARFISFQLPGSHLPTVVALLRPTVESSPQFSFNLGQITVGCLLSSLPILWPPSNVAHDILQTESFHEFVMNAWGDFEFTVDKSVLQIASFDRVHGCGMVAIDGIDVDVDTFIGDALERSGELFNGSNKCFVFVNKVHTLMVINQR